MSCITPNRQMLFKANSCFSIQKQFHLSCMMVGNVCCRSGISGSQHIADHTALAPAGHQEDEPPCGKQQATGHGDALLPGGRMNTHSIGMGRRKQVFLSRKDGRSVPVLACTEQNDIESRDTLHKRDCTANLF